MISLYAILTLVSSVILGLLCSSMSIRRFFVFFFVVAVVLFTNRLHQTEIVHAKYHEQGLYLEEDKESK